MILQALCEYYQRKADDPDAGLAPRGFEQKPIPFVIVIDDDGQFVQLLDTRESQRKKLIPKSFLVPQTKIRSGAKSYATANLLWDHYGYLLQQPKLDKPDAEPTGKDVVMAAKQYQSFVEQTQQLAHALPDCPDVQAAMRFLQQPDQVERVKADPVYVDCLKVKGCNLAFQRISSAALCCQSSAIQRWIGEQADDASGEVGICLVSGKQLPIARLHDGIGQIVGKPAPLASINAKAFESYGKQQGLNFPVSQQAVFEYATALNHLLRRDSKQKLFLAGTTLVCWSQRDSHPLETELVGLFGNPDDPDSDTHKVIERYRSISDGAVQAADDQQRFYVLGLAPNAPARIVVRFWLTGTVAEFSQRIGQWFRDIEMVGNAKFGYPSLYRLVTSTALLHKADNLPPNLMAEVYLAILQGLPAPASLFNGVIRRIKAECGQVSYERACLIKACLNRKQRFQSSTEQFRAQELTMSLNIEETRIGYRLGRLFAALEKLQLDAQGGLNSTIRDRYYSSASCTPKTVFATLMRLSSHHLKKLSEGGRIATEKRLGDIVAPIAEFPSHLNLDEQGLFALGYYHQKQALYTKQVSA
ncbi:type I-C CRISPR-associated protein Cas8c/Csd1 [Ferrimonas lipolytica]|uniref:Type I-C CRISPR-associated protein Cas8c/Csd1 n=1 Tax=Ferrimonas lipolytica TaxID=2724191 RepID=A0A6H1UDA2_9GAMM|nr:type I-C CRISPR-associated protein Cas8c/Csd1 [Ferrimonas lipolytica]QIZ75782.1 type I-C CRISPR-associated protein Cas8c/Csd1 [Ferrimonas lipolytica]